MNHRYILSTNFVRNLLAKDLLSEFACFMYFLAIMAFDWLQFTIIGVTSNSNLPPWSIFGSWATFAITIVGLMFLFFKNGGASGNKFLPRYFALSVTVGCKFVVFMFAALWLISMLLAEQGREVKGWSSVIAIALINLAMFWRIGTHLKVLSHGANTFREN